MSTFISIASNDLRSTFREPIFKALLTFPFLSFFIVRWGVPALVEAYPVMEAYTLVILMWACIQSAVMFGFIYGFLFLEEKEENIWQAIQVLPVSNLKLTMARLSLGILISAIVNFVLIMYGGIAGFGTIEALLLSIQFSFAAPFIALVLGVFSKNRIEGLAQMKILNLFLILPAFIYIVPQKFMHILALVPTYWSFRSMEKSQGGIGEFALYLLVGFVFYGIGIVYLSNKMQKQ